MLAQAAATGVTHLLLSPWILLIPAAGPARDAARICRVQNESLAGLAARHPAAVRVLGAVPLADPVAAAAELAYLMSAAGGGRRRDPGPDRQLLPGRPAVRAVLGGGGRHRRADLRAPDHLQVRVRRR